MTKARPITFSPEMVRALLEGRKTQTRRVIKSQPLRSDWVPYLCPDGRWNWVLDGSGIGSGSPFLCPYGKPGDLLYVREHWQALAEFDHLSPSKMKPTSDLLYIADRPNSRWDSRFRQAMHMPRWASRLTLRITDVRVERVQDMEGQHANGHDALAEGINAIHHGDGAYYYSAFRDEPHPKNWCDPTDAFRELWNSINEARGYGWDHNPWVWCISFDVIHANVDGVLFAEVA